MAPKLTSYKSLNVGERYRVVKSFNSLIPGDILDFLSVVYSHYDDLHVLEFSKLGVKGNFTLEAVPGEDDAVLANISTYLEHVGPTRKRTTSAGATQGRGKRGKKYSVRIQENSDYDGESWPAAGADHDSYAKAVDTVKRIVDRSLAELYKEGMSADVLYDNYTRWGEEAYIVPGDVDPSFSAWSYAQERCPVICKMRKA